MHRTKPGIEWLHDRIGGKLQRQLHHRLRTHLDQVMCGRIWLANNALCSVTCQHLCGLSTTRSFGLYSLLYIVVSCTCLLLILVTNTTWVHLCAVLI
jgi:hypothetical protein